MRWRPPPSATASRSPTSSALGRQLAGRALIERGDVAEGMNLLDEAMLIATADGLTDLGRGLVYCAVVGCCQRVFALDRAREWSTVLDAWCSIADAARPLQRHVPRAPRRDPAARRIAGRRRSTRPGASATARPDQRELALADYEEAELRRLRGEFDEAGRLYEAASRRGLDPQPGLSLLRLAQGDVGAAVGGIRRVVATTVSPLGRARYLPALVEILLAAERDTSGRARSGRGSRRRTSSANLARDEAHDAAAELARDRDHLRHAAAARPRARRIRPRSRCTPATRATRRPAADRGAGRVAGARRPVPGRAHPGRARRRVRALGDPEGARLQRDAARRVFAGPRRRARPGRARRDLSARAPARASR